MRRLAREMHWTLEYIWAMDVYDFSCFIEDFKKLPPLHEIGRAFILMPGDEGFKGVDANTRRKAMKQIVGGGTHAPEWYKRGFDKLAKLQVKRKPHGR